VGRAFMRFWAARDIAAGELLTVSYLRDLAAPRPERRARLAAGWEFECFCDRCSAEHDSEQPGLSARLTLLEEEARRLQVGAPAVGAVFLHHWGRHVQAALELADQTAAALGAEHHIVARALRCVGTSASRYLAWVVALRATRPADSVFETHDDERMAGLLMRTALSSIASSIFLLEISRGSDDVWTMDVADSLHKLVDLKRECPLPPGAAAVLRKKLPLLRLLWGPRDLLLSELDAELPLEAPSPSTLRAPSYASISWGDAPEWKKIEERARKASGGDGMVALCGSRVVLTGLPEFHGKQGTLASYQVCACLLLSVRVCEFACLRVYNIERARRLLGKKMRDPDTLSLRNLRTIEASVR